MYFAPKRIPYKATCTCNYTISPHHRFINTVFKVKLVIIQTIEDRIPKRIKFNFGDILKEQLKTNS